MIPFFRRFRKFFVRSATYYLRSPFSHLQFFLRNSINYTKSLNNDLEDLQGLKDERAYSCSITHITMNEFFIGLVLFMYRISLEEFLAANSTILALIHNSIAFSQLTQADLPLLANWQMSFHKWLRYACIGTSVLIFRIFHFCTSLQLFRKHLWSFTAQSVFERAQPSFFHHFRNITLTFYHISLKNLRSSFGGMKACYLRAIFSI